jgi:hypothetical protein
MISVSESFPYSQEGNISAARTALAELDTKDKLATYTLAIASYFLLSTVTVEELKVSLRTLQHGTVSLCSSNGSSRPSV